MITDKANKINFAVTVTENTFSQGIGNLVTPVSSSFTLHMFFNLNKNFVFPISTVTCNWKWTIKIRYMKNTVPSILPW